MYSASRSEQSGESGYARSVCPRCGGGLFREYGGDLSCFRCGWRHVVVSGGDSPYSTVRPPSPVERRRPLRAEVAYASTEDSPLLGA